MDKKIAGAIGALSALVTLDASQAATAPAPNAGEPLKASSFAELLQPIPNALARLRTAEEARARAGEAEVQVAQYWRHHHHHHHHHAHWRYGWRPRFFYRHHHHHHHHHHSHWRYRGY
jgi:hypothetical protein